MLCNLLPKNNSPAGKHLLPGNGIGDMILPCNVVYVLYNYYV